MMRVEDLRITFNRGTSIENPVLRGYPYILNKESLLPSLEVMVRVNQHY